MPPITRIEADRIVSIGNAYGGRPFWYEILREDTEPDSILKSLLFVGSLGAGGTKLAVRQKLNHPSSRVRAAACKASGRLRDSGAAEQLHQLKGDPAARVRTEASHALAGLRPNGHGSHLGHSNIAAREHKPLVLISDDSRRVQEQLTEMLAPLPIRLTYATTLAETLDNAHRLLPDAVITDNQKGRDNYSGLRLTGAIAHDPVLENTIVVMISADHIPGPFLWEGGDAFFSKAFVPAQQLAQTLLWLTG